MPRPLLASDTLKQWRAGHAPPLRHDVEMFVAFGSVGRLGSGLGSVLAALLGVESVAVVLDGVRVIGAFDLLLELVTLESAVFRKVLHAAEVALLVGALGLLNLRALGDR